MSHVRNSSIVKRNLATIATICSLLWAAVGVSVLVMEFHEHHHHAVATHNHNDAFDLLHHCHGSEESHHHVHELTAPLSASRTSWSGHLQSIISQANAFVGAETGTVSYSTGGSSGPRNPCLPAFLMHCALLT